MAFSEAWDRQYSEGRGLSRWPWSDLVSHVMRYARPRSEFQRVLEVGCAAGANIPFFQAGGFDYYAVEGSHHAIAEVHKQFPELGSRVALCDFTAELPFPLAFDLIVDRGSLTCNDTNSIRRALALIHERLRDGGKLIAIDWFSTEHSDANRGDPVDAFTRTNFPAGSHVHGLGTIHFSTEPHLRELLSGAGLKLERLEHKRVDSIEPCGGTICTWNFVATRYAPNQITKVDRAQNYGGMIR